MAFFTTFPPMALLFSPKPAVLMPTAFSKLVLNLINWRLLALFAVPIALGLPPFTLFPNLMAPIVPVVIIAA
jgi:hypothetical protein